MSPKAGRSLLEGGEGKPTSVTVFLRLCDANLYQNSFHGSFYSEHKASVGAMRSETLGRSDLVIKIMDFTGEK